MRTEQDNNLWYYTLEELQNMLCRDKIYLYWSKEEIFKEINRRLSGNFRSEIDCFLGLSGKICLKKSKKGCT